MGASIGLVDGARISPDVAPFWEPPGRRAIRSEPHERAFGAQRDPQLDHALVDARAALAERP